MEPLNPPAEVRPAAGQQASLAALINKIADIEHDLARDEKLNLERAVAQGRLLLELKAGCDHGEWLLTLAKTGIKPSRAQERMRLAKCTAPVICQYGSIREALASLPPDPAEPVGAGTPPAPPPPPAIDQSLFCREHRTGQKPPNWRCQDCIDLRRERAGLGAVREKPTPGTKPIKDGAVAWSLNEVVPFFGKALAGIGRLWIASGRCQGSAVKEDPEYLGLRRRIVELENDVRKMSRRMLREAGKTVPEDQTNV